MDDKNKRRRLRTLVFTFIMGSFTCGSGLHTHRRFYPLPVLGDAPHPQIQFTSQSQCNRQHSLSSINITMLHSMNVQPTSSILGLIGWMVLCLLKCFHAHLRFFWAVADVRDSLDSAPATYPLVINALNKSAIKLDAMTEGLIESNNLNTYAQQIHDGGYTKLLMIRNTGNLYFHHAEVIILYQQWAWNKLSAGLFLLLLYTV